MNNQSKIVFVLGLITIISVATTIIVLLKNYDTKNSTSSLGTQSQVKNINDNEAMPETYDEEKVSDSPLYENLSLLETESFIKDLIKKNYRYDFNIDGNFYWKPFDNKILNLKSERDHLSFARSQEDYTVKEMAALKFSKEEFNSIIDELELVNCQKTIIDSRVAYVCGFILNNLSNTGIVQNTNTDLNLLPQSFTINIIKYDDNYNHYKTSKLK